MGPVRLKDVDEAQVSIVNNAKELADKERAEIAVIERYAKRKGLI